MKNVINSLMVFTLMATMQAVARDAASSKKVQSGTMPMAANYADVLVRAMIEHARHEELLKAQTNMLAMQENHKATLEEVREALGSKSSDNTVLKRFIESEILIAETKIVELTAANKTLAESIEKLHALSAQCSEKL